MNFVIAGAGYTGMSVIKRLPKENTTYISRTKQEHLSCDGKSIDLDNQTNQINLKAPYALLYSIPPNPEMEIDIRLPSFLNNLHTLLVYY
jgi:hypothetical protein